MPKTSKAFPTTLNFGVDLETKQRLAAVGYFTGQGGEISSPARNFINETFRRWYAALTDKERERFEEILTNVKIEITK
jgi:hypothetical protein